MFGFVDLEDGAGERYITRAAATPPQWPVRVARHAWWIAHNTVAHPLIGLLPVGPFFRLHDWTSRKMHGK